MMLVCWSTCFEEGGEEEGGERSYFERWEHVGGLQTEGA